MDEQAILDQLRASRKVFLIEPPYKRKYLPLGLAKIATFVKASGGEVIFGRYYTPGMNEDLVCVTSLFTYEAPTVIQTIRALRGWNRHVPIILGGVAASIVGEDIRKHFPSITLFQGYSQELDQCPPDYSINWHISPQWQSYSFVFTSRGCPNHCPYCAVWRVEPHPWLNPNWKAHIHPEKPNVMISDNNLSAQPFDHIQAVCEFLIDQKKYVMFDNGFDANYVTPELARLVARLKFVKRGMRLAFDRMADDGTFQAAVGMLTEAGVSKHTLQAYILFNFMDTPREAIYRATECVKLGVRPYPQQYVPLTAVSRTPVFIGKYWTPHLVQAFRYFYLMMSYYRRYRFEEWIKTPPATRFKLDATDYALLEL